MPLYEAVMRKANFWGNADNMMFVVGATRGEMFKEIRRIAPDNFLLVPGVGAQGGSLAEVSEYGMNKYCGLLVNASRSIIYASSGQDFAERAREEARKVQQEMEQYLAKLL
jgi:orotidine-5'-phosphate decarboxylase